MYNNGATIARCLRSILDQEGVAFEVVVVDDDSSDDGASIAASMLRPQDRLVRNPSRLGLNGNHNRCLELARGRCVQFVHGDDWLLAGALRRLARYFDDPAVGVAFAPRRVVSDDLEWQRQYNTLHHRFRKLGECNDGPSLVTPMILRGKGLHNWIGEPTCVMFRRQLALEVGAFRTDIYQLVDLDLWVRLMLRSTVCFVPQELSVRSHSGKTETNRILATRRWWLDQLRVLTWLIVDPESPSVTRVVAGMWWLPTWLRLAQEVLVYGPDRWPRLKVLALAPFREFAHARHQVDVVRTR
jgi:GT2 family glycosyltransferase